MLVVIPIIIFMASAADAGAQNIGVKTNLLYDATRTINVGVETILAPPKWTFDLSLNYNAWANRNGSIRKHAMVQPEFRYWLCDRFAGHFFGFHLHGGIFNIGNIDTDFKFLGTDFSVLKDYRCQGWFGGAGVSYGYAIPLDVHWNIEFELGAGYAYSVYDQFECAQCGEIILNDQPHHYVGLTKAAVSIVYLF
ncbi:MAG: DUF3575 domain-containing protein [Bacteroidales bacterium]|nr:DUF3575 domain-containing protein [Bacteroidales bacterium]